jgi:hydroxymethylbilane synthase
MSNTIRIATRGSALALAQSQAVLAQCQAAFPSTTFELTVIKTTGDKLQTASLSDGNLAKGLFTKELETALLDGQADIAVHSLKDLPTELPGGLKLAAVTARADVQDVIVYRHIEYVSHAPEHGQRVDQTRRGFKPELSIAALPYRATVGTSSTRRGAQLLEQRHDLQIVPLRGNVGTRLRKLNEQSNLDAIVLARAGLDRLKIFCPPGGTLVGEDIPEGLAYTPLSIGEMLPCVGQGALALEVRAKDDRVDAICGKLNHVPTQQCTTAERSFLAAMGGGCQLAVAAYAKLDEATQELVMQTVSYLGKAVRRAAGRAPVNEGYALGERLAAELRE